MASKLNACALLLLAVATLLHSSAAQSGTPPTTSPAAAPSPSPTTHIVGESTGWVVPSSASYYATWATGKSFNVGDILVFNFTANRHDVAVVTKESYDSCNTASPLALYETPPVRVTLNESGEHYFLCAIQGHCSGGQKLAINVSGSGTATPSSPPPSGASSLGVAGFSVTLFSIAAALLY